MATTKKQEVEAEVAIESVKEADKKVADIKAERAAKKAARMQKRLQWKGPFKPLGTLVNAYDENPGKMWTATALGGGLGGLVVLGVQKAIEKFGNKTEEVTEEETPLLEEANEAPFDTEA